MSTTTTPEGMEVGGSTVPTLQIGGPGYGFPCNTKPSMDLNPAVAHLIGRRPGRGGGGFGGGSVRPLGQSQNSNGVSARRIQEALISNRLAQAVGELATIQIRDALEKAFFPGQSGKNGVGIGGVAGNNLRARLGLGHGRIIKTGGGGARGGRGRGWGINRNGGLGGGSGQKQQQQPRVRKSSETHRWGKWGKDADKDTLDAELDRYVAERSQKSSTALDAELDRYHATAAVAAGRLITAGSDNVIEKIEFGSGDGDGSNSLPSTQESDKRYRNVSNIFMNIRADKDKDIDMDGDDFEEDSLEIDEDC